MITIERPVIHPHDNLYRLEASVSDEKLNKQYSIYFEVEEIYKDYLCDEMADAFMLAVLPSAVLSRQDITLHANVSPKLLFNIKEVQIPYLSTCYKTGDINIFADSIKAIEFHASAFGTGCSLGVDSLSTIYRYTDASCIPEYRITHLCYFGACHLGISSQDVMNEIFYQKLEEKKRFAQEIGLPIVFVNTNLAELFRDNNVDFDIMANHYNASCALALQKLFKKYAIASTESVKNIKYFDGVECFAESSFVPYFGNENTDFILSDSYVSRSEKTRFISNYPLTPKYLDVCIAIQEANWRQADTRHLDIKKHRNCGCCSKCLRTLLTIETLGKLDEYAEAFDLDNYRKERNQYLNHISLFSNDKVFFPDINSLIDKSNIKLSLSTKIFRKFYHGRRYILRLYKNLCKKITPLFKKY